MGLVSSGREGKGRSLADRSGFVIKRKKGRQEGQERKNEDSWQRPISPS